MNQEANILRIVLNQGQKLASIGFFEFLFDDTKEMIISGSGGVGKTFLMGYLIDEVMPRYYKMCTLMAIKPEFDNVVMTATTNKAREVLSLITGRPVETIHSFLNLKVVDNLSTGQSHLSRTHNWRVHERLIIFVDECSMVDSPLRKLLHEGTQDCKIIYVGDHCQLTPVMEGISPIYRDKLPLFELTEPMRNAGQPALVQVCKQLRDTVESGIFQPIQVVPGVIYHVDSYEMELAIKQTFSRQTRDSRILAYTNNQVIQYNDYIRDFRGLSYEYTTGEFLINTNAIMLNKVMLSVEEEVEIIHQSPSITKFDLTNNDHIDVRESQIKTGIGRVFYNVPLPVNRAHYRDLLKYYSKNKQWTAYFKMKNAIPDLRARDAATIHKAQGSTYDTVFIDVGNLSTCHNASTVARLLNVGLSRARNKVVLYGDLSKKYGGIIH